MRRDELMAPDMFSEALLLSFFVGIAMALVFVALAALGVFSSSG
jgi:hypothetical protein